MNEKAARCGLKFRLISMIGFVLGLCMLFASIGNWLRLAERQASTVSEIVSRGGKVWFAKDDSETRWYERSLVKYVGQQRAGRVIAIDIEGSKLDDRLLSQIGQIATVQELLIVDATSISDDGVRSIAQLPQLKFLRLIARNVTSEGILPLAKCNTLEHLILVSPRVDDDSLPSLMQMKGLRFLLLETSISDEGIRQLAGKLSDCHIEAEAAEVASETTPDVKAGDALEIVRYDTAFDTWIVTRGLASSSSKEGSGFSIDVASGGSVGSGIVLDDRRRFVGMIVPRGDKRLGALDLRSLQSKLKQLSIGGDNGE